MKIGRWERWKCGVCLSVPCLGLVCWDGAIKQGGRYTGLGWTQCSTRIYNLHSMVDLQFCVWKFSSKPWSTVKVWQKVSIPLRMLRTEQRTLNEKCLSCLVYWPPKSHSLSRLGKHKHKYKYSWKYKRALATQTAAIAPVRRAKAAQGKPTAISKLEPGHMCRDVVQDWKNKKEILEQTRILDMCPWLHGISEKSNI